LRYLGIDFGERHIGVAIGDDEDRIAVPMEVVTRSSDPQAIAALLAIAGRESADGIVIGEPRRLDGTTGDAARRAQSFAAKLRSATALPILLHDEALTSHEAHARLRQAGTRRSRRRDAVHAVAAQILLQDWLDRRRA
jgi:putative Holliday junction resolvase